METTTPSRREAGLDEMTVGAPRSAREALQSGAISLEALRFAHRMRDGRSALDVLGTLASFALERWIVAPLGQYLHYEHHVFPSIPNYDLPHVHRLLVAAGIPVPTNRSYVGFLFFKMRAEWKMGRERP